VGGWWVAGFKPIRMLTVLKYLEDRSQAKDDTKRLLLDKTKHTVTMFPRLFFFCDRSRFSVKNFGFAVLVLCIQFGSLVDKETYNSTKALEC
jgi:hypothetical protein